MEKEPIEKIPGHVAIIMDGNGRWAKQRGKLRVFGHRAGVETLRGTISYSAEVGVKTLTIYAFSTENWKRPSDEVQALMGLLVEALGKELAELHENNVRILPLGAIEGLPKSAQAILEKARAQTAGNTGLQLQIALNYGGRAEILSAAREIIQSGSPCETEEDFARHLWAKGGDVDLLIRTGGEMRISNFLLWQCAYAECIFIPEYWPDFTREVYHRTLLEYASRHRRFGGL